jgi:hypothetical protein
MSASILISPVKLTETTPLDVVGVGMMSSCLIEKLITLLIF